MKAVKQIFSKPLFQRISYFLMFVLFSILVADRLLNHTWANSSFGISYFFVWLIPSIILLYQVIFNNKIGWILLLLLYTSVSVSIFINFLIEMVAGYSVKYIETDFLLFIGLFLFITIPIGIFIHLLKPLKK